MRVVVAFQTFVSRGWVPSSSRVSRKPFTLRAAVPSLVAQAEGFSVVIPFSSCDQA